MKTKNLSLNKKLLILDTSVILSFLLSFKETNIKKIFELIYNNKLQIASSDLLYKELTKAISAEKYKKSRFYNERTVGKFIAWYKHNTLRYEDGVKKIELFSRDANDNMFLSLAEVSNADFIISVDKDLLEMIKIGKTKIVTPKQFILQSSVINKRQHF